MWGNRQFSAYLGNTGFAGLALAMQQLLLSWILIGILELPADQVGVLQALIGIPGIFLMLWGGARSDAADPKRMLTLIYFAAPIFPVFLICMQGLDWFSVITVMVWALGVSVVQALSTPAQQAILNRVSEGQVQQGVTAATAITYVVQIVGLLLAGQLDVLGLPVVLLLQAMSFAVAGWAMRYIHSVELPAPAIVRSPVAQVREGLRATLRDRVVFSVLCINFVSTIFNAGSFMTVFPYIVKRIYDGDAQALGLLMALFFTGAVLANALMLRFTPMARPGRVYLSAQLSRAVVLVLMYVSGDWWMLMLATFLWGLNMGVTSNLARSIVQESAEVEFRGRILSVFAVGMLGTAPLGALILGWLIETVGTLEALIPAMFVSVLLTAYGVLFTPIWRYASDPPQNPAGASP